MPPVRTLRAIDTLAVFLATATTALANDIVILNGRVIDPATVTDNATYDNAN